MKKGLYILIIGLFGLTLTLSINQFSKESSNTPDSGWDYDYGGPSGGYSGGGGSSYDHDHDYGGYSEGSSGKVEYRCEGNWWSECGGKWVVLFLACAIPAGIGLYYLGKLLKKILDKVLYKMDHSLDDILFNRIRLKSDLSYELKNRKIYDKDDLEEYKLDYDFIIDKTYHIYEDVQYAWSNFDYDTLRNNLSDELYNNYVMQLEGLKLKNQQNIMSNIEKKKIYICGVKNDKGLYTIEILLYVRQKDYIVDTNKPRKAIRGNKKKHGVLYKITYTMSKKKNKKCPNCGAKLNNKASEVCSSCGSVITSSNHELVMVKKEVLSQ